MKEEKINEVLKKNQIDVKEHSTIYGTVQASTGAYNNGLGNVMHTMKDHVIHINHQGVTIVPVDDNLGSLKEDELVFIPQERIQIIRMNVKFFSFGLEIQTDKGKIIYKIRKNALGSPWHKENLSYLLLRMTQ